MARPPGLPNEATAPHLMEWRKVQSRDEGSTSESPAHTERDFFIDNLSLFGHQPRYDPVSDDQNDLTRGCIPRECASQRRRMVGGSERVC